ncbi:hypothetical protein NCCP691_39140 [Noviherbaspirillum aridicola]|uniref:histidine kinase n=2 Tax=Noviherbaspirillum aridicola TaxID=2849687 RepID=A0ABQ4QAS4_9BURK|nr:hypothetical protein NCCP691_39140 [Noviherbaspirillum aridicola]
MREGGDAIGVLAWSDFSGWSAAVGVPVKTIEAAATKAVSVTALGLIAAIACAVIGALILSTRILRALEGVRASAALLTECKAPPVIETDIAEVSEIHQTLHHVGNVLEQTEAARTRHLSEAQSARAVAEAQNKAKDQFLAMLGHELRNPLAAISAGTTLLQFATDSSGNNKAVVDAISRQTDHLNALVDDLLDATRVMTGKLELKLAVVDLGHAARSSLDALMARGIAKDSTVKCDISSVFIKADRTRLDQMLTNLLENAFKYTERGGAIAVMVAEEDSRAIFQVSDNGVGIDSLVLPKLFDVFVQGPVTNRSKGGLGIGLAIVRALAELHGAQVTATSAGAGKGATFGLEFPLVGAYTEPSFVRNAQLPNQPCKKILVIEDNADIRNLTCQLLETLGHEVIAAADGATGILRAEQEGPSVALVDIDLPDTSGHNIARHLRANPATSGIRLFALTGYGQESDREAALESGFERHFTKPLGIEELGHALEQ